MLAGVSIINEPALKQTVIKVIGCGGGGSNAVNRMIEAGLESVEFIVVNTDLQALNSAMAPKKIGIGAKLTEGLGAGGKPEIGEKAAEEDVEQLTNILKGANMVFITAGMGGGTGTGAAPVIARIAKSIGALTVAVVTKPFDFEGPVRMDIAEEGIKKLHKEVDSLIVIPNQNLLAGEDLPVLDAYRKADDVLRQGIQGIAEIITKEGIINLDFNDVKTTMENKGNVIMGIGTASGENRVTEAATAAINNPMLEDSRFDGAKNILVNIISGPDFTMKEVSKTVALIKEAADPNVHLIYGQQIDYEMQGSVSVTVIAAGFSRDDIVWEIKDIVRNKNEPEPDSTKQTETETKTTGQTEPPSDSPPVIPNDDGLISVDNVDDLLVQANDEREKQQNYGSVSSENTQSDNDYTGGIFFDRDDFSKPPYYEIEKIKRN